MPVADQMRHSLPRSPGVVGEHRVGVDLLRRAFDGAMQDPEFLAEAARMQLAVASITGEQVQALIRQVYATPKDVVAKAALASRGR